MSARRARHVAMHNGAARAAAYVTIAAAVSMTPAIARATTSDCSTAPDGTPCSTQCRIGGTCRNGQCVGGPARPEGTPCASGNACTQGDTCRDGICKSGPPLDCMPGPCETAVCDPQVGCVYTPTCFDGGHLSDGGLPDLSAPPDLAGRTPDGGQDLAMPDASDLGRTVVDGSGRDDSGAPARDLSMTARDLAGSTSDGPPVPTGDGSATIGDGGGRDAGVDAARGETRDAAGDDLASDGDAAVTPGLHVHGSGCHAGGGARPFGRASWLATAMVLALLLGRRRRRGVKRLTVGVMDHLGRDARTRRGP